MLCQTEGQATLKPLFHALGEQQGCVPWTVVHDMKSKPSVVQSVQEDVDEEAEGRRPKRRSSNAGVQYSEDLSDAMFNRLLQPHDQPGSASEVTSSQNPHCRTSCTAVLPQTMRGNTHCISHIAVHAMKCMQQRIALH